MAAALAGALPKAKAATPGAKTAAAQVGRPDTLPNGKTLNGSLGGGLDPLKRRFCI